jgi:hypothetical protein
MASPRLTPLPPSIQTTLELDLATGSWTATTRQFFEQILQKLKELEQRIAQLEP